MKMIVLRKWDAYSHVIIECYTSLPHSLNLAPVRGWGWNLSGAKLTCETSQSRKSSWDLEEPSWLFSCLYVFCSMFLMSKWKRPRMVYVSRLKLCVQSEIFAERQLCWFNISIHHAMHSHTVCIYIYIILLPVSPRKSGGLTPLRRDHFLRNSWPKSSHPGISSVLWNSRVHFWDVEHVPYTDFLGFLGCGFCGVCGAQTWVSSKHQTDIF